MSDPGKILVQIDRIIAYLIEVGLSSDQNFGFRRQLSERLTEVTFNRASRVVIALRSKPYREIYEGLVSERAYSVKFPDGALLQMTYMFDLDALSQHRLAFFPAPHLDEFQNNAELYMEDPVFADVVAREIVPFPVRFDFDNRDGVARELIHPKSHLTLGQYANCRIPVSAPLTPYWFVEFVLRNFYNTAFEQHAEGIPRFGELFECSIYAAEREIVHLRVPQVGE